VTTHSLPFCTRASGHEEEMMNEVKRDEGGYRINKNKWSEDVGRINEKNNKKGLKK
jgi:hypothetical protein